MNIDLLIKQMSDIAVGWPLMIFVVAISIVYTVALKGIQFSHFCTAWKATLFPSKKGETQAGEMSPFHAFINTINSNLGNGSIAGVGTGIAVGGPGAALWILVFGLILMAIRFAEVYVSALYGMQSTTRTALGGPMVYLKNVPGGKSLPYLYAIACFFYGILGGCAFQANSIQVSLSATWGISPIAIGMFLFGFVLYILCGGADRIVKISMTIVPVKIFVFVCGVLTVLGYHYASLPAALMLIVKSGLGFSAFAGGVVGFSVEQAIRSGMTSSIFATESGVGSAAILFGSTGSNDPVQSGMMGMISTFLSMLFGFLIALCIVVSGVWNSGFGSTALTIAAFETAMGVYGGWIVSFLSVTFGFGVLVSYAYIVRMLWLFLTNNRFPSAFVAIYSLCTLGGALASVGLVWDLINLAVAGTLIINLYGLLMLLPKIRKDLLIKLDSYKA